MVFSEEEKKKFAKLAEDKTVVIVTGVNYIGQPFETRGIILSDKTPKGKYAYIGDDSIGLYVGQNKRQSSSKMFVPLKTRLDKSLMRENFYLAMIRESKTDKVIYENEEFDSIDYLMRTDGMRAWGHESGALSLYARTVKDLIGKPVIINGNQGVIRALRTYDDRDTWATVAEYTDGYSFTVTDCKRGTIALDKTAISVIDELENQDASESN